MATTLTDIEADSLLERDGSGVLGYDVTWPTTPEGWCAWYRALDRKYKTDPESIPLGHNYRCPIHGHKPR